MGWVTRAPMPTARYWLAAGVIDGLLYAVGGWTTARTDVNEAYDPSTDTWASRAAMPMARERLAVGVVDSSLYAVGGNTGSETAVNQAYDPSTDTWSSRASMPTARSSPVAGVINGILYAVGGWTVAPTAVNEAYDPSTDTWSTRASMPTARRYLAAGVVSSTLYAVGGNAGSRTAANEAYDPSTNTWSSRASMPTVRDNLAAGVVNGLLYVVGGFTGSARLSVNEAYDPSTDTWAARDNMPTARERLAAGVVGSTLYAVGGYTGSERLAVNEAYTPTGTVTGTVRDAATLQPLMGVTVSSDDGQATTTGPDGTYTLAEVIAGTRTITFSAAGYNPRIEIITVPEDGTYTLNVDLVPAAQQRASIDAGALAVTERSHVRELYQVTSRDTAPLAAADRTGALAAEVVVSEAAALAAMETPTIAAALTGNADIGPLAVTERSRVRELYQVTSRDTAPLAAADRTGALAAEVVVSEAAALAAMETPAIAADLAAADAADLAVSETPTLHVVEIADEHRVVIQVADRNGVPLGPGPIVNVLACEYQLALDEIGSVRFEVPATDDRADLIQTGREIAVIREGEGVVFRGVIRSAEAEVDASGAARLVVEGDSRAVELLWANTLLGRAYDGVPPAAAVDDLLSGTGWTRGSIPATTRLVSARFEGVSIWNALVQIAETFGWHVVEDSLTRTVHLIAAGEASGLVLRNVEQAAPDLAVLPITRLRLQSSQSELWNRVIPLGEGEGITRLTLQYSDRTSPYPIQSAIGPDGQPYWYIEDAASIAARGLRVRVLSVKDAQPLSNSPAAVRDAANALYDIASAWLAWHTTEREAYEVEVVGLTHYTGGAPALTPGQTVRLIYRGLVESPDGGRRLWKSIDRDLYVLDMERSFSDSGADAWRLTVSTVDQPEPTDADAIAKAVEDLWTIQTALKPITFVMPYGPLRQTIDANHPVRFEVDFDANIRYLHKATLRLTLRPIRANATTAAAGGGTTSASGGSHSHTVSGQTAQAGAALTTISATSHSHTLTGLTGVAQLQHRHGVANYSATESWSDPPFRQQLQFQDSSGTAFGVYVGRGGAGGSGGIVTDLITQSHNHTVGGITAEAESAHQHQVPGHSHTVTGTTSSSHAGHTHQIPAHTHGLEYGIFEGSLPPTNQRQVRIIINGTDRTAELGGPFSSNQTLDVTQWLVDSRGVVRQQRNTIQIQAGGLMDIEVTLLAMVTATQLVPV